MSKHLKYVLHGLFIFVLIVQDIVLKFYIVNMSKMEWNTCENSGQFIHFHPTYNTAGSFLALKLGTQISSTVFILLALFFSVIVAGVGMWCMGKLKDYQKEKLALIPFDILLAGTVGRVVERCIWQYTLDYIAIKNIAICDLLDIYLFVGAVGVGIVGVYIDYLKGKKKNNYNLEIS